MKISTPEIKVIRFSSEDVIVASSSLTGVSGSFFIPSKEYSGFSASGDYVEFTGTIGRRSSVGYLIGNISGVTDADSDEVEGVMSGGSYYFPDVGVTIPASPVMESMARQYYEAFNYDGQYYTKGTYYDLYWQ